MEFRTFCCMLFVAASGATAAPLQPSKSTIEDQTSVELTVYNSNLGLVKDVRKVALGSGEGELRFMDVAAQIIAVTVYARSLNRPDDFAVLEQNYEYDLMNADKLLDKYVGKKIKIIDVNEYKDKREQIEAILLSNNNGQIFKINNEIYLGHSGYKVLPELPEDLIANPTLTWLYASKRKGTHELEVSYLTNGINWSADYVLILNADDTRADLSGWVTVENGSGAAYRNARLKLVAGKINRAADRREDLRMLVPAVASKRMADGAAFEEKEFFEYHIYDLQRTTTIKNNQTKQISLLEAQGFSVEKEMVVYGAQHFYSSQYREHTPKQPVNVYIKFKNSTQNRLGMPLPEGVVRVYKRDHTQSQQLVGEDRIEHTPKDEEVKLKMGEAFDVVAERKQTDYQRISDRTHETEWEVVIRNHKKEAMRIGVVEPLHGDWKILKKSHEFIKQDAFTARFDVSVPGDGEAKLTYRVRVKY